MYCNVYLLVHFGMSFWAAYILGNRWLCESYYYEFRLKGKLLLLGPSGYPTPSHRTRLDLILLPGGSVGTSLTGNTVEKKRFDSNNGRGLDQEWQGLFNKESQKYLQES